MQLLVLVNILRQVLPIVFAIIASANSRTISHNFSAGAGIMDSGLLQGALLPLLLAGGSWVSGWLLNRQSGISPEFIEFVHAVIAFAKNRTRRNALAVGIEAIGLFELIANKFGVDITSELGSIQAKLVATLGPSSSAVSDVLSRAPITRPARSESF